MIETVNVNGGILSDRNAVKEKRGKGKKRTQICEAGFPVCRCAIGVSDAPVPFDCLFNDVIFYQIDNCGWLLEAGT